MLLGDLVPLQQQYKRTHHPVLYSQQIRGEKIPRKCADSLRLWYYYYLVLVFVGLILVNLTMSPPCMIQMLVGAYMYVRPLCVGVGVTNNCRPAIDFVYHSRCALRAVFNFFSSFRSRRRVLLIET